MVPHLAAVTVNIKIALFYHFFGVIDNGLR